MRSGMAKRHVNKVGDLESMFLRLEELVLANSGEDEFEEVFKLLVAKLADERSEEPGRFRALPRESETHALVLDLLREAEQRWPGILDGASRPNLTAEHLQVCVEALAPHTLGGSGLSVMDGFFEFLVSKTAKGSKGQYFTPRYVIDLCVRILKPRRSETVLDPACGSGGFLLQTLHYMAEENGLSPAEVERYCASKLWGFDIDSRAVRVAKALMILAGDGSANVMRLNSLVKEMTGGLLAVARGEGEPQMSIEDILRVRLRGQRGFDVIMTNPPFAGEVRERVLLEAYDLAVGRSRIERDVLFVERCLELLRPGGRMAIVLPHNKFASSQWREMREWVLRRAQPLAVVGLGRNTFLPHTHQKAGVLFLRKRVKGERASESERVFFAISEHDGKNSKGQLLLRAGAAEGETDWARVAHDLDQVLDTYEKTAAVS